MVWLLYHNDDLGQLAESFNAVLANLQGMIRSIQDLSGQLAEGAGNGARQLVRVHGEPRADTTAHTQILVHLQGTWASAR